MMNRSSQEQDRIERPLLFVNKDAENFNITSAEAFAINSHVSSTHRKWMKSQRLKQQQQQPKHLDKPNELSEALGQKPKEPPKQEAERIQPPQWRPCRLLHYGPWPILASSGPAHKEPVSTIETSESESSNKDTTGDKEKEVVVVQHPLTVSLERQVPSQKAKRINSPSKSPSQKAKRMSQPLLRPKFASEPFAAAVIRLTPETRDLLSMAQRFHVFPAWPIKMSKMLRDEMKLSFEEHLSCAIADEGEINALLAAGCYSKALLYPEARRPLLDHALRYKTRTVQILRQRIQRFGGDYWNIFMLVRLLLALDFFAGDYEAARFHQSAAQRFMSQKAFVSQEAAAPRKVRLDVLSISDVWLAVVLIRHTEFNVGTWDPGPRRLQKFNERLLLSLKTTMREAPPDSSFAAAQAIPTTINASRSSILPDPVLRDLMGDIQELVSTKTFTQTIPDDRFRYEIVVWLHKRATALTGRLINHFVTVTNPGTGTTSHTWPFSPPRPRRRDITMESQLILLKATVALDMALFLDMVFADAPCPIPHARVARLCRQHVRELWRRVVEEGSGSPDNSSSTASGTGVGNLDTDVGADVDVDADLMLWLLFTCAFYADSAREGGYGVTVTDEADKDSGDDEDEENEKREFRSWATTTIAFWFFPPSPRVPPPNNDVDHAATAAVVAQMIKTKLKTFLYLDAQMDAYLSRMVTDVVDRRISSSSSSSSNGASMAKYEFDGGGTVVEDQDGQLVFVGQRRSRRRHRHRPE